MNLKILSAVLLGMIVSASLISSFWYALLFGIPEKNANAAQLLSAFVAFAGSAFFIALIITIFVNLFKES